MSWVVPNCVIVRHRKFPVLSADDFVEIMNVLCWFYSSRLPGAGHFPVEERHRVRLQNPRRQRARRACESLSHTSKPISSVLLLISNGHNSCHSLSIACFVFFAFFCFLFF